VIFYKEIFSVSKHLKSLVLRFKAGNDKSSKDKVDNYLIMAALMPILMMCFMLVTPSAARTDAIFDFQPHPCGD
jgi:hypothetical protein